MPGLARLSDPVSCGDTICEGSGNVFANGLPITRIGVDDTCGHCYFPTTFTQGVANLGTVFVNNIPVVIIGDPIVQHVCPGTSPHGGNALPGSLDVKAYG